MSYRPDDWHTKIKMNPVIFSRLPSFEASIYNRGFEAGADAMLGVLKKGGLPYPPNPIYIGDMLDYRDGIFRFLDDKAQDRSGHIVFIPDDKAIKGV